MEQNKPLRLLRLYTRLQNGEIINKKTAAQDYAVAERSIQRDIEDLRCFLNDSEPTHEIIYDAKAKGYRMTKRTSPLLDNSEILAVCKILLESRSMRKDEIYPILEKLITCCVPEHNKKAVQELIANEKYHYIEPHHNQSILSNLWELGQAIQHHSVVEITYERMKEPHNVTRKLEPVGIMFSEYYFYLTGFLRDVDKEIHFDNKDDLFPTIYRIDRIRNIKVLDEHFRVSYKDRFEEGEFRKRVQFMYGGKLERIKFRYKGQSLEAVLDRLPTAQVLSQDENGWLVSAEVFGKGIDMWLRSQGELVEIFSDYYEKG